MTGLFRRRRQRKEKRETRSEQLTEQPGATACYRHLSSVDLDLVDCLCRLFDFAVSDLFEFVGQK